MKLDEKGRPNYIKYHEKKHGYKLVILILSIVILIIAGIFLFHTFYFKNCGDANCFISAVSSCKKVSWLKEDGDSAWMLKILGKENNDHCKLYAKLVILRSGTIDSEKLIGKEMTCTILKTETNFPPSDMSECTGMLKEELQDVIITRMHDYLLKNLGEVKEEFNAVK